MEFFLAPRQGGTLFTLYTGYIYMERKREIQYAVYQRDRKGLLCYIGSAVVAESKPSFHGMRSQFILCVSYYYRRSTARPLLRLYVSLSTGQILDRRIKRGYLSIYLLFPGRWIVVACNYLKPVFEDTLLSFNFFVREIFVKRVCFVSLDERDKMIRQEGTRCRHASIVLFS